MFVILALQHFEVNVTVPRQPVVVYTILLCFCRTLKGITKDCYGGIHCCRSIILNILKMMMSLQIVYLACELYICIYTCIIFS